MTDDSTTAEQRAYYHTLRYLIAEAKRPRESVAMRTELRKQRGKARRVAKLRQVPWDEWQVKQEQLLVALMDEQCIPVPEDLRMATD